MRHPLNRPRIVALCLLIGLVFVPTLARAQETDKLVNLDLREETAATALVLLFKDTGIPVRFSPPAKAMAEKARLTIHLEGVGQKIAIDLLVRTIDVRDGKRLTVKVENDVCYVNTVDAPDLPRAGPPADRSPDRRLVTYNAGPKVKEVTAWEAVNEILKQVKTELRAHPDVRKAMEAKRLGLRVDNLPVATALWLATEKVDFGADRLVTWFEQDKGFYVFMLAPIEGDHGVTEVRVSQTAKTFPPAEPLVTGKFQAADVRYALKELFSAAGKNYTLDAHVLGRVTLEFKDLPLGKAVDAVLKANKGPLGLNWKLEGGVYSVSPNPDYEKWR